MYYNYPIWDTNDKPFVDLGLPSGTLWATMNVGAKKSSDAGQYFQWGDTSGYTADQVGTGEGQKKFADDWSDYKWYLSGSIDDDSIKFKKYTTTSATLDLEDDAAHVRMGGDWHMPTPIQIQELIANTTSSWTTQDNVYGRLFTSKKDKTKYIFIPAAGGAMDGSLYGRGRGGVIRSSMLDTNEVYYGQNLSFESVSANLDGGNRCRGFSVRGVIG